MKKMDEVAVLSVKKMLDCRVSDPLFSSTNVLRADLDWVEQFVASHQRKILANAGVRTSSVPAASSPVADGCTEASPQEKRQSKRRKQQSETTEDKPTKTKASSGSTRTCTSNESSANNASTSGRERRAAKRADTTNEANQSDEYDDAINIKSLKVAELRTELRKRGLDTSGLKKELQKRLADAIEESRRLREELEDETKDAPMCVDGKDGADVEITVEQVGENVGREISDASKEDEAMEVEELDPPKEAGTSRVENCAPSSSDDADMEDIDPKGACNNDKVNSHQVGATEDLPNSALEQEAGNSEDALFEPPNTGEEDNGSATRVPSTVIMHPKESVSSQSMTSIRSAASSSCAPHSHSTSSPKKSGSIGMKILKATSKIFSPPKEKESAVASMISSEHMKHGSSSPVRMLKSSTKRILSPSLTKMPKPFQPKENMKTKIDSIIQEEPETEIDDGLTNIKNGGNIIETLQEESTGLHPHTVSGAIPDVKDKESKTMPTMEQSTGPAMGGKQKALAIRHPIVGAHEGGLPLSNVMNTMVTNGMTSAQAKKKALAESRKARLAEIRGKSKPVHLTRDKHACASATNAIRKAGPSPSKGKLESKDDKRKIRFNHIREKAAAAAAAKKQPSDAINSGPMSRDAGADGHPNEKIQVSSNVHAEPKTTKSSPKPYQWKEQTILSPMDTYEMSDRGESESDDSSSEDESPKKRIPTWALRSNLVAALKKQYTNRHWDPDDIFGEVDTCNLEAVFERSKSRYKTRSSTGNWARDGLTAVEKLAYKREMGFGSK